MAYSRPPSRWAVAALGLSLFTLTTHSPDQGKNPSLAGTWKYSAEKTAAAELKKGGKEPDADPGYSSGGRPKVGTSVSRRGGSEDRGAGGGAGGGGGDRGSMGPLGMYARPLPQIVITQTDSTIIISDPSGYPRTYRTDGNKAREPLLGADTLEIVAKWKGGKLTTERKLGSFGTVREIYSIDPAAHELTIEVKLTSPQMSVPMEMKRIYDAPPGA